MAATQTRDINPERLAQARLIRGLSRQEIADAFEITRQAVSQYENGICRPKPEIMRQYQTYLDMPLNFFYSQPPQKTNTAYHFRKLQKSTYTEQGRTAVRLGFMAEVYSYFSQYMEFPETSIPMKNESDYYNEAEIEAIVTQVRDQWNLKGRPIKNITGLMENYGCIISKFACEKNIDIDACSKIFNLNGEVRPFITLISNGVSSCRERFSLAHELGHIILHSWADVDYTKNNAEHSRIEKEANYFAGAFLLPFDEFSREALSCSAIDSFIALKDRWKVSIGAMIMRAKNLSIISNNQTKYLFKQINLREIRKKEPLDDVIPHDEPQNMYNALNLLTENSIKSGDEILEDLTLPVEEVSQICGVAEEQDLFFPPKLNPIIRLIEPVNKTL